MTLESVKKQIYEENLNLEVLEFQESTATVEEAAKAVGVELGQIAKTMAFKVKEENILIVAKGDSKIDNRKFKDCFKTKAKMMSSEEVMEITGHIVGGVCPFGLKNSIDVYLDESLKEFYEVYPAAGSCNSAVKITIDELEKITNGVWIDVCK
ncbi:Cys-tRNA(Pro) deacylase [Clostridium tetanomorphum]|uniref:YbaK/EbsC family protein n=1 Tax=Clostridium tetanomorphum TaxID=1553 RepID=A0A923EDR4_CLOTT|nr:YbaK/EbsC family protein [Clostridium tetanomorphum]KAJ51050.1 prolyl-tRNA synthetase [Clostridium tetanomorphum DSM 665]MBC2399359.1 YbaK/EbsC family protein [Clostridium tetanomorphum]MBP1865850.1 Cys-tRNA(Pro) deacylase [Clostridium tetanomorphum]NRS85299.1 Cys-tRNA(Pro) deacylase [Clostridium tetanomorphum]NRZ98478.1 Cys-tRNA(Pro) deacylase [Clostridium tetanomorphum]